MKRTLQIGCAVLLTAVLFAVLLGLMSPSGRQLAWALLPSHFHGQVVDQNGDPVEGADIKVLYPFVFSTSSFHLSTNRNGTFSTWIWLVPRVDAIVSKAGYAEIRYPRQGIGSRAQFQFADGGRFDHSHPPVFHLWKQGPLQPLIAVPKHKLQLARDGGAQVVSFHPDMPDSSHALEIHFWMIEEQVDPRGRHDWRGEIRVPHGGLLRRRDEFAFQAPETGYVASESIVVSPGATPKWDGASSMGGDYFVRFDDGLFARCTVLIISSGTASGRYALFESVLNPRQGSRNLEVDLNARH